MKKIYLVFLSFLLFKATTIFAKLSAKKHSSSLEYMNEIKFSYTNNDNEIANIQLLDINGQVLIERQLLELKDLERISTDQLPAGIYILMLQVERNCFSEKVIKI